METNIPELQQEQATLELAEKIGEKVADGAVTGYKAIEHGVVTGYHKIEDGVVSGYRKIEDTFVSAFLKKDGESVEEAKVRLGAQQSARQKKGENEA